MSLLTEPIQLTGIFILAICVGLFITLGIKLIQKYLDNKTNVTLIFALNFLFTACALACIATNRILLNLLPDPFLGVIFHNIAIIFSLIIVVFLDVFAFLITYPEKVSVLSIIVSVLMAILMIILLLNQPTLSVGNELVYSDTISIVALSFLIPPIAIPITVFFYYAAKVKDTSRPKSIRSTWMGIASIIVAVAYLTELAGNIGVLTVIIRLLFLVYGVLMYNCFIMPDWFKRRINWDEEA